MNNNIINKLSGWIKNKNFKKNIYSSSYILNSIININDINKMNFIEDKKSIFTQEMIDILFEEDINILMFNLIWLWHRKSITNNFLKLLHFIANKENSWKYIPNQFWLIYISSLYQTNTNLELAEYLLHRYIKKYDLTDIHNFLHAAKFAEELGIVDDNIKKSVFILEVINNNIKNEVLENKIKNKKVAIIGNGPQELGKGKGKYIDSYDIVIRLNGFGKEYQDDYGNKTDIWIDNLSRGRDYPYYHSDNFVCLAIDINRFPIPEHNFNSLYNELNNDDSKVTYIDSNTRDDLIRNIGEIYPTTGLISIFKIFEEKKKNNEILSYKDIYGFSFLDRNIKYQDIKNARHYYNNDDLSNFYTHHEIYKEILFLRNLFNL